MLICSCYLRLARSKISCARVSRFLSPFVCSGLAAGRGGNFCADRGACRRSLLRQTSRRATKSSAKVVGLGRVELPTSPLSGVRSNQLSYRPRFDVEPESLLVPIGLSTRAFYRHCSSNLCWAPARTPALSFLIERNTLERR
jgi:hypothetical protein